MTRLCDFRLLETGLAAVTLTGVLLSTACGHDWNRLDPRLGSGAGGSSGPGGGAGATTGVGGGAGGTAQGWFDPDWQYRKRLVIHAVDVSGDLTDFPLLVSVDTDSDLAAHAQRREELVFTTSNGQSKLAHEVELFGAGGRLVAWVRLPSLARAADTLLYLYYGNASATDQQDTANVWDASFVGVWHLSEASGARFDSTAQGHDVAEVAGPIATIQNAIAGDATLDLESASSQYLSIDDAQQSGLDVSGPLTISAWINSESQPGGWRNCVTKWATGSDSPGAGNSYYLAEDQYGAGHRLKFVMEDASSGVTILLGAATLSIGTWYHAVALYDGSEMAVYVDGVPDGVIARATGAQDGGTNFEIGNKGSAPTYGHDGPTDEVRVSNVARSAEWIATEHQNQRDPAGFVTVEAEEPF